jgi:hypothetical protein
MSTKGILTRERAIQEVGIELMNKLDHISCEPSGRLQTDGDDTVEYVAQISAGEDADGFPRTLRAYYYPSRQSLEGVEDLSDIKWTIDGYEIV